MQGRKLYYAWLHSQEPHKGMIKHFLPIKSLDLGRKHKHLNRRHVSDYPLVLHCNNLLVLVGNRLVHKLGTSLSTVLSIQ